MTGIRFHMATALTTCLLFFICTCCLMFKTSEASPQEGRWPGEHHWEGHRGRRMGGHRGHGRRHDPPGLSRSDEYWDDEDEPPPPPPPGWGRGRGHRNGPPPHSRGNGPPPHSRGNGPPRRDWSDGNRPPPPPEWEDRHRPPPPEWQDRHRPPPPPPPGWDDRHRPPPPEWDDGNRPPPPEWDDRHRPPPPPPRWEDRHRPPPPEWDDGNRPPPPPEWEDRHRPPPAEWNDNNVNDRATPQTPLNPVISPTPPPNSGDTLIVGKNPPPLPVPVATDKPDPYWSHFGRSEEVSQLRNIIFPNSLQYVYKPIEVESNDLIDVRRR